jgi:hypothetical protein
MASIVALTRFRRGPGPDRGLPGSDRWPCCRSGHSQTLRPVSDRRLDRRLESGGLPYAKSVLASSRAQQTILGLWEVLVDCPELFDTVEGHSLDICKYESEALFNPFIFKSCQST